MSDVRVAEQTSERREFDVWNEVPLVPQLTGMSCWAAAAAMIIGWRDVTDVDPEQVATGAGRWAEYRQGLHPVDLTDFARAWGLAGASETQLDWSAEDLRRLLERYGPVWLGEASPGLHSIVITGMYGDGSADNTWVRVNDPWPVGRGERYCQPWRQLMQNFRAATDLVGVHAQVLHTSGRRRGPSGSYHFEERHSTRIIDSIPSSKDTAMSATEQRSRHHEDYPLGFGSVTAYAATVIAAGETYLDTRASSPDPLAGHGGTGDNLCLVWNQVPNDATSVDVVVYLHGYSDHAPDAAMLRAKVATSGIDLAGRTRPTLAIIARGRKITPEEVRANPRNNAKRYTFPALTRGDGAGLEALVAFALTHFKTSVLASTAPTPLRVDRLIISAHSGGGSPLNQLLGSHAARSVCNPHEVHVFDAFYGDVAGVTSWARARIAADRALAAADLATRGGGLRIAYGDGTATGSRNVAHALPASGDPLQRAYRAEQTSVAHDAIPRAFGPTWLTDVRAELVARARGHSLSTESLGWEESRALAVDDDARAFLAADASGRAPLATSVAAWVSATDRSAIELLPTAARRQHFLDDVDWAHQDFQGRGTRTSESEALFNEMERVIRERRVPGSIRYHDVASVVQTVPGTRYQLYPDAKDSFVAMRDAARTDGVTLTIGSAWRSEATQRRIAANNPNPAAVAQRVSTHNYGLAVDLNLSAPGLAISEISTASMPNMVAMYRTPAYKWMALHGREHGWFPYRREPWHWEYNPVGFKERFEAARVGNASSYGAPVGLMERYRNEPPEPVAVAKGEVDGDVDPRTYEAHTFIQAIGIIGGWLARRARFTIGVDNTTIFPHSAICQLRMRLNGGTAQGTGWYIGNNRILTAAHCLVFPGDTLHSMEIFPGKTNNMSTFGSFTVSDPGAFVPHPRYNGGPDFDLAVIKVNTPPPNGNFFELEELRMSPETGIAVCGYAAQGTGIDRDRQHMDIDTIRDLEAESFTYSLHARHGTSGGPTFYILGNEIKAVGVLSRTNDRFTNRGCRLTDEKIRWIRGI